MAALADGPRGCGFVSGSGSATVHDIGPDQATGPQRGGHRAAGAGDAIKRGQRLILVETDDGTALGHLEPPRAQVLQRGKTGGDKAGADRFGILARRLPGALFDHPAGRIWSMIAAAMLRPRRLSLAALLATPPALAVSIAARRSA